MRKTKADSEFDWKLLHINERWGEGYPSNEVRGSEEAFGAPQRVVEVRAVAFELRREAAVDDGQSAGLAE